MEELKLKDEEIQPIRDLRTEYNSIIYRLGQLKLQIHDIQRAKNKLEEEEREFLKKYESAAEREKNILDELYKKYGNGEIDSDRGIFIKQV